MFTENISSMNSPISTNANSPTSDIFTESCHSGFLQKDPVKRSYVKLKTLSSKGEWVIPEQKSYQDLNTIFQEKSLKSGHYKTEGFEVFREHIIDEGRKELKLLYSRIIPENVEIKAQMCIIHGLEDHSGRYLTIGEYFAKNGFLVHLIDLNGFGNSELTRENTYSIEEYHKDIALLLEKCDETLPMFMLAQGLGAGVLLSFLIRNQRLNIAGVIVSSAMIKCPNVYKTNFFVNMLIKTLMVNENENMMICSRTNPSALSKNNYYLRNYLSDDQWKDFIHVKLAETLKNIEDFLLPNAFRFNYPLLTLMNMKNALIDYNDSLMFHQRINSRIKNCKAFQNGYHNIFDDNESEEAKSLILQWCDDRLQKSKNFVIQKNLSFGLPRITRHKKALAFVLSMVLFYFFKMLKAKSLANIAFFMKLAQKNLRKTFLVRLVQIMNMLLQPFKI